jgi:hypothetical protein
VIGDYFEKLKIFQWNKLAEFDVIINFNLIFVTIEILFVKRPFYKNLI